MWFEIFLKHICIFKQRIVPLEKQVCEELLNQSFDSDDLEAFDVDPVSESSTETDESGYGSSDQFHGAIDRALLIGLDEERGRLEREINEIENENWFHPDIDDNQDQPEIFHLDLPENVDPSDLPGTSQQNSDASSNFQNLHEMSQCVFCEAAVNESCHCDNRLSAGSTISWSSSSISRREGAAFHRRDSYPVIAEDFDYSEADDELSGDEVDDLSSLLRAGLSTRDGSPLADAASRPQQLALQESGGNLIVGDNGHHARHESDHSAFSEEEGPVRYRRRRHHVRHGVKRYRTQRSPNRSSDSSAEGQYLLRPVPRFDIQCTCLESDVESPTAASDIDRMMGRNYPQRSRRNIRRARASHGRLWLLQNQRQRRRQSHRYLRSLIIRESVDDFSKVLVNGTAVLCFLISVNEKFEMLSS
ncbi:unnamed protein product [Litomosoides sigmodontis]|uniref:Uncharacterized protein n=1 Tax=Litomosoides sigmodontis TaxID=42156 RepID=A0A3P6SJX5_LITSI|nr:unnamed protein product [Litomosoides sigmodontis]